jgi:predicted Na+-dependent transporter
VAAATGLFIACPTCAGTFLSLFVSSSGALALTLAITQIQTILIGLTIPLLVLTPVIMAKKIKGSGWSCKIEF